LFKKNLSWAHNSLLYFLLKMFNFPFHICWVEFQFHIFQCEYPALFMEWPHDPHGSAALLSFFVKFVWVPFSSLFFALVYCLFLHWFHAIFDYYRISFFKLILSRHFFSFLTVLGFELRNNVFLRHVKFQLIESPRFLLRCW
jgi:hypothetical protein